MAGPGGRSVAAAIGRVGVWSFAAQRHGAAEERTFVEEIERLGYGALWIPESIGSKDAFAHAAILLSGGSRISVCTGIANVWARDPMSMANGGRALAEAFPGRFVLGIGVSHAPSVAARGAVYVRPLERMREYLTAMETARYDGPQPEPAPPVLVAALGPRMLEIAAELADGAHTYFVPVEHTLVARERLGSDPALAVEMTAVLDTDAARAREVARGFAARYLELPNYANNLRRLGWSDEDLDVPGSDALIDAVIAWGDAPAIGARVQAHLEAGADHVAVQFVSDHPDDLCLAAFRELAATVRESER
ncbi:MAG TPA: TIGR03620 family F420-dependent LLM class oxidoreductase [Actinomycetota bacterium]